ncbi:MAG: serine hydrolase domain-containing protein, partial [Polyangiaceae bacterium]
MRRFHFFATLISLAAALLACGQAPAPVSILPKPQPPPPAPVVVQIVDAGAQPEAPKPWEPSLDAAKLGAIDAIAQQAIAEAKIPGCVVEIGRRSGPVFTKAYGNRQIQPFVEPMTIDTVFDMASLTKPMATAASIQVLVDRDALTLDEPASKTIPELKAYGKGDITIRQLLTHTAGLRADTPLDDAKLGHA